MWGKGSGSAPKGDKAGIPPPGLGHGSTLRGGAPGKRGDTESGRLGRRVWSGHCAGGPRCTTLPSGSGYLATRRHPSQQALLPTRDVRTTRPSMPRGPDALTTRSTMQRPPFPRHSRPCSLETPPSERCDPFPALRAARSLGDPVCVGSGRGAERSCRGAMRRGDRRGPGGLRPGSPLPAGKASLEEPPDGVPSGPAPGPGRRSTESEVYDDGTNTFFW